MTDDSDNANGIAEEILSPTRDQLVTALDNLLRLVNDTLDMLRLGGYAVQPFLVPRGDRNVPAFGAQLSRTRQVGRSTVTDESWCGMPIPITDADREVLHQYHLAREHEAINAANNEIDDDGQHVGGTRDEG